MVEQAYTQDLKSCALTGLRVRLPLVLPINLIDNIMKNIVGFGVNIKPQFRNQLDGDPNSGVIVEQFSTYKIKVFWCNGTTSSHDKNSPYMQRFEIKEVL